MGLNVNNKHTWWFVSMNDMMLMKSPWNESTMIGMGAGDSVQRTYEAYVTYRDPRFVNAIRECWRPAKNGYKPQRYPVPYLGMHGMSRDHVIYSILAFNEAVKDGLMTKEEMVRYIDGCPFKIGTNLGTLMTLRLWTWMQLMAGRWIGKMYYPLAALTAVKKYYWNKFVNSFSGIDYGKEVWQGEFNPVFKPQKSKLINFYVSLYYPTYAVKLASHMISVVPQNRLSEICKKFLLKNCPEDNVLIKALLLDGNVSDEDMVKAMAYKSMTCDRWSAQLNPLYNDRPIYIVSQRFGDDYVVENNFDKDYLLCQLKR
jgi:hypothetical protein